MKSNEKKYIYICDNCGYEFSMKTAIKNHMVECSRCGEKTAYCDDHIHDDYINLLDINNGYDSDDMDYDDQLDYYE